MFFAIAWWRSATCHSGFEGVQRDLKRSYDSRKLRLKDTVVFPQNVIVSDATYSEKWGGGERPAWTGQRKDRFLISSHLLMWGNKRERYRWGNWIEHLSSAEKKRVEGGINLRGIKGYKEQINRSGWKCKTHQTQQCTGEKERQTSNCSMPHGYFCNNPLWSMVETSRWIYHYEFIRVWNQERGAFVLLLAFLLSALFMTLLNLSCMKRFTVQRFIVLKMAVLIVIC